MLLYWHVDNDWSINVLVSWAMQWLLDVTMCCALLTLSMYDMWVDASVFEHYEGDACMLNRSPGTLEIQDIHSQSWHQK